MRKFTYRHVKTGQLIYSDTPKNDKNLKQIQTIRGGSPRGMEKRVKRELSPEETLALDGPKV